MSTRKPRAPIWTQPAPGARRPKLSREKIAEVALAIADAEGFEAVSMRRIATDLDVGTMTLYYYVRTKDDLLALMDDALMGEVLIAGALPTGWRAALTAIATANYEAFMRHPWALRALQGARLGPNGLRHVEQSLAAIADLPLPPQEQLEVLAVVDDLVFGHVLRVTESWAPTSLDARAARSMNEFTAAQLATGDYPLLAGLIGDSDPVEAMVRFVRWMTAESRFARGLAALLDGIEVQLRARAKPIAARAGSATSKAPRAKPAAPSRRGSRARRS